MPMCMCLFLQDNTNLLHIEQWSDGKTHLRSVGILLAAPGAAGPADQLQGNADSAPVIKNSLWATTNTTLLPALLLHAAVSTPVPLLVYITSNATIGMRPRLPASGVVIRRPVVFVGMVSLPTSINFEMVVNQLNASSSMFANVTFVSLVLENLAPGDSVSSAMAAPFSIAITNNVWAVYYNRCV